MVELKDKLETVVIAVERPAPSSPAGVEADVVSALTNLGYEGRAAENAVERSATRSRHVARTFEKLLRAALQALSQTERTSRANEEIGTESLHRSLSAPETKEWRTRNETDDDGGTGAHCFGAALLMKMRASTPACARSGWMNTSARSA